MDKIISDNSFTFFLGYLEDRISVIVSAAILWDEWNARISHLNSNPQSISGTEHVKEFAKVILGTMAEFKVKPLAEYVQYKHSLIMNRRLSNNAYSFLMLIRKFKKYFDSVARNVTLMDKQNVCTFTSNTKYMMQLKRYLKDVIQITHDMNFKRQAHLFSLCDILVTPVAIDLGTIFVLKPKIIIIGLNADENWVKEICNFWNIDVIAHKINFSSRNSLVSLSNFVNILKTGTENQYLMFMPWEQLNNQLIGFKAACAMAVKLNRILVLPYLGYRINNQWNFSFDHRDYSWSPMENYFDFVDLPCKIVSLSSYKIIHGKQIGSVHFNPVAKATSHQQLKDYYMDILGLHFTAIKDHEKMSQLNDQTILKMFGEDKSKVLSFGSLFWTYGFNKTQEYPLKKYVSYMDNDLYRQITKGIITKKRISYFSKKSVTNRIGSKSLVSVHIRRGDYWDKCKAISDPVLQSRCFPNIDIIKHKIQSVLSFEERVIRRDSSSSIYTTDWDQDSHYVYISTNLEGDRSELKDLLREFNVLFFEDVHDRKELEKQNFDPIHTSLLDKELGINSDIFIGNFYSSFSRTIFEGRELLNRTINTF